MHQPQEEQRSTFRLDVPLHQLLTTPVSERVEFQPGGMQQRFPDPVFPQHPELFGPVANVSNLMNKDRRYRRRSRVVIPSQQVA